MARKTLKDIADQADMIIRGYAFTREDDMIRVINLNDGESCMIFTPDGIMIETNMDAIEQALVLDIWAKNSKYMESEHA